MATASMAWFAGRVSGAAEPMCEATRHRDDGPAMPTEFTVLLEDTDGEIYIWGSCRSCLSVIAGDLGLDPDADALELPDRVADAMRRYRSLPPATGG